MIKGHILHILHREAEVYHLSGLDKPNIKCLYDRSGVNM